MIYSETLSQNKTKSPKIPGFRDAYLSTFDLSIWESEVSLIYIADSRPEVHSETMLHFKKERKGKGRKRKEGGRQTDRHRRQTDDRQGLSVSLNQSYSVLHSHSLPMPSSH